MQYLTYISEFSSIFNICILSTKQYRFLFSRQPVHKRHEHTNYVQNNMAKKGQRQQNISEKY